MTLLEKVKQMERIDALIKRKATGSPKDLAKRLGASERYVYKLIKSMKIMGAPIYFDYDYNSYCYEEEVTFFIGFQLNKKQIKGGCFHFFLHCTIGAVTTFTFTIETFQKGIL